MAKYRFEQIAINSTEKKKPVEKDRFTYIGLEHLDSANLKVTRFGSDVAPVGEKLVMRKGDVLFGKRRAYQKKVAIAPFDGIFSAHGMVLRPNVEIIDPDFFPLFISSDYFLDAAIKISVGSLSPTINWRDLKILEFDLPDLKTQRKLAAVLWSINNTMESYKKLISATDELVKSQFVEMFYGKGYPVKKIGDVIEKKIDRVAKIFEKSDEIQYLDISSIDNSSKMVTGLTPYVLKDAPSRAQYVLKQGDIMYSTVRPNLQNIAVNPYSDDNVVGSTGFCVLRCTGVTTGYMWGVINSVPFTESMINQASGANYPAVTDKVVHAYEIPIPPLEEQAAYEQLVNQSDKSKFELEQALAELTATYKRIIAENLG
ncbi:restriction endonuclease subunit S [Akkermansia muciniphila]|uniref:restriction endonuclease subunit S n=1 Tax=Akkermansia muciniphila TaxID=239935 RepID=UPI0027D2E484|nr:restriction endonuclease subunit S [Akkermansia muciniphila]WMB14607.1 restriction endonuclease subunit S [Akkermansia muciniphila]